MERSMQYPPGSVIEFTSGEYSDYRNVGSVVTIQDCDLRALAQKFWDEKAAAVAEDERDWRTPDIDDFPTWLIVSGYAMPLACSEVHLGEYSEFGYEFGVTVTKEE